MIAASNYVYTDNSLNFKFKVCEKYAKWLMRYLAYITTCLNVVEEFIGLYLSL